MMKHSIYSVISPEGCAAILWGDKRKAPEAATALKLTAKDCLQLEVIDSIIEEAHGAAHRDPEGNSLILKQLILKELQYLGNIPIDKLLESRINKFSSLGVFSGE
jgi:acetyl-CoA carboxylase carboxyl transferase subunit alpha